MEFVAYYVIPYDNELFFKIREDAHIFQFDFNNFQWVDVSVDECYESHWKRIEADELFERILIVYETFSQYIFNEALKTTEGKEAFKDIVFGKEYTYYTDGQHVACQDENYNEYLCDKPILHLIEESFIDTSWQEIQRSDVIELMLCPTLPIMLDDAEIYTDEDNDIRAFTEDGRQFRISMETGDMNEVLDNQGIQKNWEKKDLDYVMNIEELLEVGLSGVMLDVMEETNKYLEQNAKELKKENIELGKDIFYYDDGFGDIYALDTNNNSFHVTSSKFEVVSRDIIDSKNWDRVNHLLFLSLAQFHEKRVEALKKEKAEYTIYDLKLFSNKEGEIWGSNKEGKAFAFDYLGRFVPVESLIDFNVSKDKEVSKIEAMLKQAEIRTDGEINEYLSICEEHFPNDYPEIGKDLGFFFKEKKEGGFNVYVADNDNNEFLCKIDRLILQKKGTIANENANPLPITDVIHTIIMDDIINKEKNDKE